MLIPTSIIFGSDKDSAKTEIGLMNELKKENKFHKADKDEGTGFDLSL